MKMKKLSTGIALLLVTQVTWAGVPAGIPMGQRVGESLSAVVGGVLPQAVGTDLPLGLGGVAGIVAVSLILGAQLIRRNKNK